MEARRELSARHGFTLLAVLWVMVGVATLALGASLAARDAVASAQNRVLLTRAAWHAEDCLGRARAAIAAALVNEDAPRALRGRAWSSLDQVLGEAPLLAGSGQRECDVAVRPVGDAVDVNTADDEQLHRLLDALGVSPRAADSLVDALLDWRDADDVALPNGAERAWYELSGQPLPRNGPLLNVRELTTRVRGFGALNERVPLDSILTAEAGRVVLDRAPLAVIGSLPGVTEEVLSRVAELRLRGEPLGDVMQLGARLSPAARDALYARYADLVRLTTAEPDAWILTARGWADGGSPVKTVIELRLVRAGDRAAIVRRRGGP